MAQEQKPLWYNFLYTSGLILHLAFVCLGFLRWVFVPLCRRTLKGILVHRASVSFDHVVSETMVLWWQQLADVRKLRTSGHACVSPLMPRNYSWGTGQRYRVYSLVMTDTSKKRWHTLSLCWSKFFRVQKKKKKLEQKAAFNVVTSNTMASLSNILPTCLLMYLVVVYLVVEKVRDR